MNNKEDMENLDLILMKAKTINGVVYDKEVRAIIEKFPHANRFCIKERKFGAVIEKAGTKIRKYYKSDEYVFIEITHERFIRFNHNEPKKDEE